MMPRAKIVQMGGKIRISWPSPQIAAPYDRYCCGAKIKNPIKSNLDSQLTGKAAKVYATFSPEKGFKKRRD
ncbi:hypothetical protein E2C01_047844 [Portunus trituberculatus]|uniref:Uncharacterized protein n=1 Tax=Portunus trituberculatus TaxID=210409 RepID=A0A5B7G247_PORTR|nr:hypothetical protein [Portunus trituberculatus]